MARVMRPPLGSLLLGACVAMVLAPSAGAASYSTYVGCSEFESASPSHVCQLGDEPGAFFESDVEVEYEVCVTFPGAHTLCREEQLAEAETLYVNVITTDLVGDHLVTWSVKGAEVASWSFRMEGPPSPVLPPAPSPSSPLPTSPVVKPPETLPTMIGCANRLESEFTFVAHPRRCIEFLSNQRFHANEIGMTKLSWSDWGKGGATAHGRWKHCGMGRCFTGPLEATASRRVRACGRLAYTRLKLHIVDVDNRKRTYSLKLPAC